MPINLNAAAAGADPDGRPAGLGQDHHLRQDRPAPEGPRQQARCCWRRSTRSARPRRCSCSSWASRPASPACRSSPAQTPVQIARRAMDAGRREGFDVVMLDTAGRLSIDEELMAEVAAVRDATNPAETLLVVDAMTGQDAVNTAKAFNERARRHRHRADPDGRRRPRRRRAVDARHHRRADQADRRRREAGRAGGFPPRARRRPHPRHGRHRRPGRDARPRRSSRTEAEKLAAKMQKGEFDLEDLRQPAAPDRARWAACRGIIGMLPGVGKIKEQLEDAEHRRQDDEAPGGDHLVDDAEASAATRSIIKASRKKRIAAGSGTSVQDVNRLLKQYRARWPTMMKRMKQAGAEGPDARMAWRRPDAASGCKMSRADPADPS